MNGPIPTDPTARYHDFKRTLFELEQLHIERAKVEAARHYAESFAHTRIDTMRELEARLGVRIHAMRDRLYDLFGKP